MLAVEQLLGVAAVGGFYQPLRARDLRPRGVLDADAGVELDCVTTDVREPTSCARCSRERVAARARGRRGRRARARSGRVRRRAPRRRLPLPGDLPLRGR